MPEPPEDKKEGEEKVSVPEGIIPLFLSTATQQIFEVVSDSDVTADKPHKLIPKEKFLEDVKNRAAVSDFQPYKQKISKYPAEVLLVVYDYEFKYGENFYLCITEEAKELILNPPKSEGEAKGEGPGGEGGEEEEEPIPTTPIPQEWVCLGSDQEIKESMVTHSRPLVSYTISRKRRFFNAPCSFTDYNAASSKDNYAEIQSVQPAEESKDQYCVEQERETQAIAETVDVACQTKWPYPVNKALQYEPRMMSDSEASEVWHSEEVKEFLKVVTPRLELCLQQNEIMDIFTDDYVNLADDDGIADQSTTDTHLKEYQSFTDLQFSKDKLVSWIEWHPTIKGIVAVSCREPYSIDERIQLAFKLVHLRSLILIWSFSDPIHPQLFLEAPEDIVCFHFNPTNPNLIAGGCLNGQVLLWDISDYQDRLQVGRGTETNVIGGPAANLAIFDTDAKQDHAPIVPHCAMSSIEASHSQSISDLLWVPDHCDVCHKTLKITENTLNYSNQIISCGLDGMIMFWELRPSSSKHPSQASKTQVPVNIDNPYNYLDLTWRPFYKVPMPRSLHPGKFSATKISISERQKSKVKAKNKYLDDSGKKPSANTSTMLPYEMSITEGQIIEDASTTFCIGTEDGEFVFCDWKPVKDPESGKPVAPKPGNCVYAHYGSVCTVERSPFFKDIILTVGGSTFSIWKEGIVNNPLLCSGTSQVTLTGGAWSPTRPGVFFIGKHNGNVDVWDLMDRSHAPALAQNVSSLPITSISPWSLTSKQLMLATGDSGGTVHILEVPWSLAHCSATERIVMESFFEREVQRIEFVNKRNQLREVEKKALDQIKIEKQQEKPQEHVESWEEKAQKDYEHYLALEDALLKELGLREDPNRQED